MDSDAQLWNWSKDCSFPSDMNIAHDLIEQVMEQIKLGGWNNKEEFAVNMALEEALTNAVQHGNHSDPTKQVYFSCRLNGQRIYVRIEDEGSGFDPNTVPDPTDPEHIMIASGRGVLLIKNFVSRIRWNEKGNVLEFEKDRETAKI
ncbi:MAG: ATP-binding protein [Planctomycetaceae bacterium]|jgi:serine/threonine-protein kinase RsbW|nr:ATP-binding protein [Planctomycetaceae bacterium]